MPADVPEDQNTLLPRSQIDAGGGLREDRRLGKRGTKRRSSGMTIKGASCVLFAAGVISAPALAQELDIRKAVQCAALSQQFSDSVKPEGPAANVEDDVKKTATDLAKQGVQACRARDYEAGVNHLRQALQKIGRKPWAPAGANS